MEAESRYEAVAVAVAQFHEDDIKPLSLAPRRNSRSPAAGIRSRNKIRLGQIAEWAELSTREGPAGITERQRVRSLLGVS